MDCSCQIRQSLACWLPWLLLFLAAGWGGAALFGQIPDAAASKADAVPQPRTPRKQLLQELRPGLSEDRVLQLLGRPNRLARQVLHLRYLEQWVYDSPFPLRIEIEHALGRPPHVLTVQSLTSEKP